MRGKEKMDFDRVATDGITPACAGKSCIWRIKRGESEDHPRVCGEKRGDRVRRGQRGGSPPRVRGKVAVGISAA